MPDTKPLCVQRAEEMKDTYPCYLPAVPFFDVCLNEGQPVKRRDCDECFRAHPWMKDYIE